jgi:hypothetical protein
MEGGKMKYPRQNERVAIVLPPWYLTDVEANPQGFTRLENFITTVSLSVFPAIWLTMDLPKVVDPYSTQVSKRNQSRSKLKSVGHQVSRHHFNVVQISLTPITRQ